MIFSGLRRAVRRGASGRDNTLHRHVSPPLEITNDTGRELDSRALVGYLPDALESGLSVSLRWPADSQTPSTLRVAYVSRTFDRQALRGA